jgi:hypothetical protein
MSKFHAGAWEGYRLGLARCSFDGRETWGHRGDGFGSHTEFWHLRAENLTIVTTWNDDALDREGQIPLVTAARRAARTMKSRCALESQHPRPERPPSPCGLILRQTELVPRPARDVVVGVAFHRRPDEVVQADNPRQVDRIGAGHA